MFNQMENSDSLVKPLRWDPAAWSRTNQWNTKSGWDDDNNKQSCVLKLSKEPRNHGQQSAWFTHWKTPETSHLKVIPYFITVCSRGVIWYLQNSSNIFSHTNSAALGTVYWFLSLSVVQKTIGWTIPLHCFSDIHNLWLYLHHQEVENLRVLFCLVLSIAMKFAPQRVKHNNLFKKQTWWFMIKCELAYFSGLTCKLRRLTTGQHVTCALSSTAAAVILMIFPWSRCPSCRWFAPPRRMKVYVYVSMEESTCQSCLSRS